MFQYDSSTGSVSVLLSPSTGQDNVVNCGQTVASQTAASQTGVGISGQLREHEGFLLRVGSRDP